MSRLKLRDDQWERIEHLPPGKDSDRGMTAKDKGVLVTRGSSTLPSTMAMSTTWTPSLVMCHGDFRGMTVSPFDEIMELINLMNKQNT
jgi:hypothetical protein